MAEDVNSVAHSSALKNFLAGGVGGIALVFAGHPLDTIKVTNNGVLHKWRREHSKGGILV